MTLILLIIVILILFGGGGFYYGRGAGWGPAHYGGGLGLILLVVVLFLLFGGGSGIGDIDSDCKYSDEKQWRGTVALRQ